ncbi:YraN family protein [Halochromatium roseum]|nr:YraN family protein [Halochromatium roseum]
MLTTKATPWRKRLGDYQEQQARRYLERQGLDHVASNVRCKRGELDLVMRDGETLVFVEVRFRASARFGGAAASVDPRKQARLSAAAAYYLQRHSINLPCRFDVIAIDGAGAIQWIRHAFAASS